MIDPSPFAILNSLLPLALWWCGIALVLWAVTFVLFLAVMKLREMQREGTLSDLHWTARGIAYVVVLLGLVLDVLLNYIVLTVVFLEPPDFIGEPLSSQRVKRHKIHGSGWRRERALALCRRWLTPVDPTHCEE